MKKNKKITQNILLTAVMATMPLLVVQGDTYQIGLIIECIAAVISLLLLFTSANRRKNFPLSHLAAILWLFIPVSFLLLLQTPLFGSGFEGLFNWAKTGLIVGIVAIIIDKYSAVQSESLMGFGGVSWLELSLCRWSL